MTALTDDVLLTRVREIFTKRADQPRSRSGYGQDASDCCLTGALYLVCSGGKDTYCSALETQSTPVGPLRSAFESAVKRLHAAIPAEEMPHRVRGLHLTDFQQQCRELEAWYDTKATHQDAADLAARA